LQQGERIVLGDLLGEVLAEQVEAAGATPWIEI